MPACRLILDLTNIPCAYPLGWSNNHAQVVRQFPSFLNQLTQRDPFAVYFTHAIMQSGHDLNKIQISLCYFKVFSMINQLSCLHMFTLSNFVLLYDVSCRFIHSNIRTPNIAGNNSYTCISYKALKHSVALDNNSCPPFPVRIHNYVDPMPF